MIPIDAFMAALPKRSCVCVGVYWVGGSLQQTDRLSHDTLMMQIASAWSTRSDRSACVISGTTALDSKECRLANNDDSTKFDETRVESVCWNWLAQSSFDPADCAKQLARDVAGLSSLRSIHGLVMIDLGSLESRAAEYASKLCDGLVLLAQDGQACERTSGRRQHNFASRLKAIQRPDCRWLGYWSLESVTAVA